MPVALVVVFLRGVCAPGRAVGDGADGAAVVVAAGVVVEIVEIVVEVVVVLVEKYSSNRFVAAVTGVAPISAKFVTATLSTDILYLVE